MRAFLVSVDYTDLLSITLSYNRHHFSDVYVITSSADAKNVEPICRENRAHMIVTDLFWEREATFNKWAALEYGLDLAGRYGWICIMDADVLWPKKLFVRTCLGDGPVYLDVEGTDEQSPPEYTRFKVKWGQLCSPLRRMFNPPNWSEWVTRHGVLPEESWTNFPIHRNVAEWAGYSQIFHADDPHLPSPPWHQTDWKHAGGADSFFQNLWPVECKVRPPFEVLHLGDAGANWCGRSTPYLDGTKHPQAEVRALRMREIWRGRVGKVGDERFKQERLPLPGQQLGGGPSQQEHETKG